MLEKLSAALLAFGPFGLLLLATIDSAGLPLPESADVVLVVLAANRPGDAWRNAALAVCGSVAGNLILFLAARRGGRRFRDTVPEPGSRNERFRAWFNRYGLVTVFIPCLVPVPLPLKIFVISAGVLHVSLARFLLVIAAARIPRYFGLAWMGMQLGSESYRFFKNHAGELLGLAAALALVLYGLIRLNDRRRFAARDQGIGDGG